MSLLAQIFRLLCVVAALILLLSLVVTVSCDMTLAGEVETMTWLVLSRRLSILCTVGATDVIKLLTKRLLRVLILEVRRFRMVCRTWLCIRVDCLLAVFPSRKSSLPCRLPVKLAPSTKFRWKVVPVKGTPVELGTRALLRLKNVVAAPTPSLLLQLWFSSSGVGLYTGCTDRYMTIKRSFGDTRLKNLLLTRGLYHWLRLS